MDVKQTPSTVERASNTSAQRKRNEKSLAPFYTPHSVAQILTDWAVTRADALVLDPSYGGCAFLNAAFTTLTKRGSARPERQIFGVDVDPSANNYLRDLLAAGAASRQYICRDFFELGRDYFGGQSFDAVVGNPPYIRYHNIPEKLQRKAEARLAEIGISISGRASYWAFFLLYSMQFLRKGGRLAMVLPGALLHTDYSLKVRELFNRHFEKVYIYLLQERIFDNTQEESVIVCAEGAGKKHRTVRVEHVSTIEDLRKSIAQTENKAHVNGEESRDGGLLRALVDDEVIEIYDELSDGPGVIRLGDWADKRIGIVTGNNGYFILSQDERKQTCIPERYFSPVIRRPAYVNGLVATDRNLKYLDKEGRPYLLLTPPENLARGPKALRKYIEQGEEKGVNLAWQCKSRDPWYVVPLTYVPEAIIPCMAASWARLMVNHSSYTCTNNLIRLSWRETRPAHDWTRLALGTISSLCQLSAELVGRSYGGGVLKLEPSELMRLAIPLVPVDKARSLAKEVEALLRQGKAAKATGAVDAALVEAHKSLTYRKLKILISARNKLFFRRRQHRNDAKRIVEVRQRMS
jgi:adenine-specific DNA-methyltransferase